jgi:peroxiredoxin
MALRRLDDAGPVVRTVPDHSGDPLRKVMIGAVILIVASLAWQFGPRIWGGVQGSMGPVTDPAAPFTLDDLSGTKVSLSDFTGKAVVVVDFWATWCGPCRASLPGLHALRKKYHGQGVEVLNINLAENPDTIKNFLNSEQLDLWVLLDTNNAIARAYGVSGIPCVFIIDKRGSIREKIVGYSPENEARIETLVSSLK